jgi:hypothetical protein
LFELNPGSPQRVKDVGEKVGDADLVFADAGLVIAGSDVDSAAGSQARFPGLATQVELGIGLRADDVIDMDFIHGGWVLEHIVEAAHTFRRRGITRTVSRGEARDGGIDEDDLGDGVSGLLETGG